MGYRVRMAAETIKTPTVIWAQRNDVVYLTIEIPDVIKEKAKINIADDGTKVIMEAQSSSYEGKYKLELELLNEVDQSTSKITVGARSIILVLSKKDTSSAYWSRLTKEKVKSSYIKIDWNKWKDEDEDDEVEDAGMNSNFDMSQLENLTNFQQQMSGGGAAGLGDLGADSDDDDDDDDEMPELVKPA